MSKKNPDSGNKSDKKRNKQEKLNDFAASPNSDNMNQNHNAKKEPLGPNTKR